MRASFNEFKAGYVEPTYYDFIKSKFKFPSIRENRGLWYYEAMNEEEFASYVAAVDPEGRFPQEHRSMLRYRARTQFGHYLYALYVHMKFVFSSFEYYKEIHYENAYNAWSYSNDEWA